MGRSFESRAHGRKRGLSPLVQGRPGSEKEGNQICGQKLSDMAKNIPVIVDHNWPLKNEQSV